VKTQQPLALTTLSLLAPILLNATPADSTAQAGQGQARAFADPAFERVWNRTDSLVATGAVKRSWYWGPQPNTGQLLEDYAEGPGGQRKVQYFDKSRMEINDPNADPGSPFYVTNGLLTRELVSGNMQTGNSKFSFRYPAKIPVAGDTGAITYASLGYVLELEAQAAVGATVTQVLAGDGYPNSVTASIEVGQPEQFGVKYAYYEPATKHNIPDVFWQFLNAEGPVIENGRQKSARLSEPYFYVTGYPVSEAYWTRIGIAGKQTLALLQAYERRVLTYVPDAPEGFKVQMGNVGQHYYDWRYKGAGKPGVLLNACPPNGPTRGFGKVYSENEVVKVRLNCLTQPEKFTTVARQFFEHGQMLSVTVRDAYRQLEVHDIYALFEDGRVQTFNWVEQYEANIPAAPTDVPPGLHAPSGTMLKVWKERNLRERLGWATGPADVQTHTPGTQAGGVVAYFDGGLMVYPNLAARQIYVLYASSGSVELRGMVRQSPNFYHADRWLLFEDTFTGN
jgi:hypothetical protein